MYINIIDGLNEMGLHDLLAKVFYYVNYGLSVIASNVYQDKSTVI